MSDPWNYSGQVAAIGEPGGSITLVDESTFAISGTSGDIVVGGSQGLFVRDTRVLSRLELRVNGARTEPLSAVANDPFSATFVSRCRAEGRSCRFDSRGVPLPVCGARDARGHRHPQFRR